MTGTEILITLLSIYLITTIINYIFLKKDQQNFSWKQKDRLIALGISALPVFIFCGIAIIYIIFGFIKIYEFAIEQNRLYKKLILWLNKDIKCKKKLKK